MNSKSIREALERFDALPNSAIVPTDVASAVLNGLSGRSLRYHPALPRHYVSKSRYGYTAGDIRKLAREGFRPIGEAARRVVDRIAPDKIGGTS